MKATHKRKGMGDVAAVIAAAPSVSAAARQLGVTRVTVHRWIKAGHALPPAGARPRRPKAANVAHVHHLKEPQPGQAPEAWAKTVHDAYELTPTEAQLLDLAALALAMSLDKLLKPETRLAAV